MNLLILASFLCYMRSAFPSLKTTTGFFLPTPPHVSSSWVFSIFHPFSLSLCHSGHYIISAQPWSFSSRYLWIPYPLSYVIFTSSVWKSPSKPILLCHNWPNFLYINSLYCLFFSLSHSSEPTHFCQIQ